VPPLTLSTRTRTQVEDWIVAFPAIRELEEQNPFLRPFFEEVVGHLAGVANFGMKARLFSGAGLSVFDLISDVYIITMFLGSEETRGVAYANIACCVLSMIGQLVVALLANRRRSKWRILREAFFTLICVKPGLDAVRVARMGPQSTGGDDGLAAFEPIVSAGGGVRGGGGTD
jgi:hypothetical protein